MKRLIHEDEPDVTLYEGDTAWVCWRKFFDDSNTFADTVREFISHCKARGYKIKKMKTAEEYTDE